MTEKLHIKRVYDQPEKSDGQRILIDRLWPRGLAKDKAHIDHWLKEIAPSDELRRWFGHDPQKWEEFSRLYVSELQKNDAALAELRALTAGKISTLLYAAHDTEHNNAIVLRDYLKACLQN